MIVDDEPLAIERLEILCNDHPVIEIVGTANDGVAALRLAQQLTPDLVFLDIGMPKMDGIELISNIRHIDSDVSIIVFTGYPSLDTAIEALKLNVSDYIKKPFEPDDLRAKLSAILKKKGVHLNPEEELHRTIGAQIRGFRKERELTLKHLSRRTSLSVSLLSQIERAESSASVGSLYKISAALGVRLTALFGEF